MAYETGVPNSMGDLFSKLSIFAQAQGWTQDEYDNTTLFRLALHKGGCYVQFKWYSLTATRAALFQSLGYTPGQAPGSHPDDSNLGATANANSKGIVDLKNTGPYTAYHFFSGSSPDYIHAVVEYGAGLYRHFSFGNLEKIGDWTGGEYITGHYWVPDAGFIDNPSNNGYMPFEGISTGNSYSLNEAGTVHAEGLPGQSGTSKWGIFNQTVPGLDRAGNSRILAPGTLRGGWLTSAAAVIPISQFNAYKPLVPVSVWYKRTSVSPNILHLLGHAPGLRVCNIKDVQPADEIVVGGDTWKFFPWVRKQYLKNDTEETWNAGLAYLKVA